MVSRSVFESLLPILREGKRMEDLETRPITRRLGLSCGLYLKTLLRMQGAPSESAFDMIAGVDQEVRGRPWIKAAFQTRGAVGGVQVSDTSSGLTRPSDHVDATLLQVERATSVLGRLLPSVRRVPANVSFARADVGATASWFTEGSAIKLTKQALERVTLTSETTVGAIGVYTKEVIQFGDADGLNAVGVDIAGAAALAVDEALLDSSNSGSGGKPAGITNGLPSAQVLTSSGSTIATLTADAREAQQRLLDANASCRRAVWIMNERTALSIGALLTTSGALAFPTISAVGGFWFGLPVLTSEALLPYGSPSESDIVLLDPMALAVADSGQADIQLATSASLEMSDSPGGSSTAPTAENMVSLYQTNSVAVRVVRRVNWCRSRDGGKDVVY